MSKAWITVCNEADLIIGSGICVRLGDEQVAVFREKADSEVYAISNYDPFGEVNVISRGIIGSIGDKLVVASPLYKQHFCLETGQCLEDESVRIKTYPVRIETDQVQLQQK
ncbi:nitrite reductase small subunit NirD [Gammaproteobacteria bacterium]|nr:nitrite reductase small subunit NirD [Gammaproteobacteria bacterium]